MHACRLGDGKRKGNEGGDTFASLASEMSGSRHERRFEDIILRKEVIQPQVPLRLPCYDFTPVADPTLVPLLPFSFSPPPSPHWILISPKALR